MSDIHTILCVMLKGYVIKQMLPRKGAQSDAGRLKQERECGAVMENEISQLVRIQQKGVQGVARIVATPVIGGLTALVMERAGDM